MSTYKRFEDLPVWQTAATLYERCDDFLEHVPPSMRYPVRDQLDRAAFSVSNNIAEGFDGGSNAEFVKFLRYSQRSCSEVQSQLYIALDQTYISQDEFDSLYEQAARTHAKVGGFIHYLLSNN